jgi:hypothetical protein
MAGSDIATTPYYTITSKGGGSVIGFWVGFSLGTCCRIWLGPHIHFILIPDSLHTYRKYLKAFKHGWQSYCHNTIPCHHSKRGRPVVGFWVGFSLGTCCRIWLGPLIHFILIPHSLHTYRKCLKAFNHGWQSYCHKTIPYHHSKRGWASRRIQSGILTGDML